MAGVEEILGFWFGKPGEAGYGKPRKVWFVRDAAFDLEVRLRFLGDCEWAAAGKLEDWQSTPAGCLALAILLDQFPRNMFRGQPQAFATDSQALAVAHHAVAQGFDRQMLPVQRWFIYLPFEHSENVEHQRRSVELFRRLSDDPDSAPTIDYAVRHQQIIERFGRFPHRNQILGRETTPEEAEFLKQPGSSF
ncbi:DUF924 family protein [Kamptonema formosum]|uniref:DUF924 family protein n=1 Tax=Kamptonema formosum TaxID=331992 RepID=UPI00034D7FA5|nr:DUF924 family protein [Oscillatoria sp. PCC 10802]